MILQSFDSLVLKYVVKCKEISPPLCILDAHSRWIPEFQEEWLWGVTVSAQTVVVEREVLAVLA